MVLLRIAFLGEALFMGNDSSHDTGRAMAMIVGAGATAAETCERWISQAAITALYNVNNIITSEENNENCGVDWLLHMQRARAGCEWTIPKSETPIPWTSQV